MVALFDRDGSGTINLDEFRSLWGYIESWKKCFDGYDADRSGAINANELGTALAAFGYNLSPQFVAALVRAYDRQGRGEILFDSFINASVRLQALTDEFRKRDSMVPSRFLRLPPPAEPQKYCPPCHDMAPFSSPFRAVRPTLLKGSLIFGCGGDIAEERAGATELRRLLGVHAEGCAGSTWRALLSQLPHASSSPLPKCPSNE